MRDDNGPGQSKLRSSRVRILIYADFKSNLPVTPTIRPVLSLIIPRFTLGRSAVLETIPAMVTDLLVGNGMNGSFVGVEIPAIENTQGWQYGKEYFEESSIIKRNAGTLILRCTVLYNDRRMN